MLKKLSLALGFFWLPANLAGTTIYDNTVLTGWTGSCPGCVLVDDVLIPSSRNPLQLPIAIRSITIGAVGVGQVGFSIYSFSVNSDGTPAPDPVLIDEKVVTLTGVGPFEEVTFGDGLSTLFTVRPNFSVQAGFGVLYLGLGATPPVGWADADGPDINLPTEFVYNPLTHSIVQIIPPDPMVLSGYIRIDGTPLPEPVSILSSVQEWRSSSVSAGARISFKVASIVRNGKGSETLPPSVHRRSSGL